MTSLCEYYAGSRYRWHSVARSGIPLILPFWRMVAVAVPPTPPPPLLLLLLLLPPPSAAEAGGETDVEDAEGDTDGDTAGETAG